MSRRRARGLPVPGEGRDAGQMMMLTAVILLAAFLALSATLARVNTLSLETGRERTDPFPHEFTSVQRGLEHVALRLDNTTVLAGRDYTDAFAAVITDLERIEGSRGFSLSASVACSGAAAVEITFDLQDADTYGSATWTVALPESNCS